MAKTRILIADDHAFMRIGLKSMLELQPDIDVVGEAGSGLEAVAKAASLKPDVVIIDLRMPELDGAEATRRILASDPDVKVIVLTSFGVSAEMARALEYGAVGAQLKESPTDDLLSAIRTVVKGEKAIAGEIRRGIGKLAQVALTERQRQILAKIASGCSDKEIGRLLGISRAGVQKHLAVIFEKIGATNRTEAVALAVRRGIIDVDIPTR